MVTFRLRIEIDASLLLLAFFFLLKVKTKDAHGVYSLQQIYIRFHLGENSEPTIKYKTSIPRTVRVFLI